MLDSGAPYSCVGMTWINRYLNELEIDDSKWTRHSASLSGIGSGSAEVNWKVKTPIGLKDFPPAMWETQVLEGVGKHVPALLGLAPMKNLDAVIDLRNLTITVNTPSKTRKSLQCFQVHGHLMLPIDWGGKSMANVTK